METAMYVQCCVCKRVREDDAWVLPESGENLQTNASHGYCPECAEAAFREIREMLSREQHSSCTAHGAA